MGLKNSEGKAPVLIKKDIVNAVSGLTLYSQEDIKQIVEATFYVMRTFLEKAPVGSSIAIRGLGTFNVKYSPKWNANYGEKPERRRIKFRPGFHMKKELMNLPTMETFLKMKY